MTPNTAAVYCMITGGAKLEYIAMEFSCSEYLASISGIPEYQITIW